ncbi:uncharacterized protein LOC123517433 isoform X2 [Portunus trituberculatus]|uniref:uncharacterized protein LOC123517433 isoform X2 n=1 Tax=Portunus trituberculatus TaxID=210409 RepID=UPI001E1CB2AE|nr:uncharacterized protein LOC123517433 isoform X2 [Portunus trituberculatus]
MSYKCRFLSSRGADWDVLFSVHSLQENNSHSRFRPRATLQMTGWFASSTDQAIMGIRDLTASILWLASFLLAFTPHTHQHQNNWRKPTVIRVLQGGVNIGSDYDDEINTYKVKATTASEPWVKVVNVEP